MTIRLNSVIRQFSFPVALSFLVGYAACGGGGGDGDDLTSVVTFTGSLSDTATGRAENRALSGIVICALGTCATTDSAGLWGFTVPQASYPGGNISFSFNGGVLGTSATVPALGSDSSDIQLGFLAQSDNTVTVVSIIEDGVSRDLDGDDDGNDGEGDDSFSSDPSERACQILERSNISIPNVSTPIIQDEDSDCPLDINALIVVGNQRPIPYDYEVTVDFKDAVVVDPSSGTLGQGVLNIHDAQYLCTRSEDFVATVTARVTRYYPPDGSEPITTEDAIALCGSGAAVGNTSESVLVTFDVLESSGSSSSGSSGSAKSRG